MAPRITTTDLRICTCFSVVKVIKNKGNNKILQVELRNQIVSQRPKIGEDTQKDLQKTNSTGKFFNKKFRGKYQYDRIDIDHNC